MNNRTAKKIRRELKTELMAVAPHLLTRPTEYEDTGTHTKVDIDSMKSYVVSDTVKLKKGFRLFTRNAKHNYNVIKSLNPFATGNEIVTAAVGAAI